MREGTAWGAGGMECLLCPVRLTLSQGICSKLGVLLLWSSLLFSSQCLISSHGPLKHPARLLPLSPPASAWSFVAASEGG